jgi:predicted Zn-ribbon and HTH transcriptional regulator
MVDSEEVKEALELLGVEPAKCRSCGEDILFFKTINEKWMPTNLDLTSHFSTCPQAGKWKKRGD